MNRFFKSTRFLIVSLMGFNLLALAAVVVLSTTGLETMSREEDREYLIGLASIEDAYRLRASLDRQVVGLRGYLLTGNKEFLTPYMEGGAEFESLHASVEKRVYDAEDAEILKRIEREATKYQAYGQLLIELVDQGKLKDAQELFKSTGIRRRKDLNAALTNYIGAKHLDLAEIHDRVNQLEIKVRSQLMVGFGLAIPISLLFALLLVQRVLTPLRSLTEASRALADANTPLPVPKRHDDEFGEVADAFNKMAASVAQSMNQLQHANAELQRADRSKDDFLHMVTHEMKTPLTAIRGFARMLERGTQGPLNDRQKQSVARIVTSALRMQRMVTDLLDSNTIRQGKLELSLAPTSYGPLVEDVAGMLQPLLDRKELSFSVEVCPDLHPTLDAARISQVLVNLVSNAVKFTPNGGSIRVTVRREAGVIRTEVADTGIGIPEEFLPQLFQPFVKLNPVDPENRGGSGLGLWICHEIVEAHGGTMGVDSTPDVGSTFWFTLPEAGLTAVVPEGPRATVEA